ncbi:putative DNA-binding domain-containing protein [uncultured Umboniibacter sp.]|uniref:HvfC family RiPP maturation protein n=1 Tax=uncultured Umboniibacter sp. TaxID=1798917 RepID=UPI0026192112|nr:putative DNA-binding domain-containing protein [uncultured Umboniibacter sp.]
MSNFRELQSALAASVRFKHHDESLNVEARRLAIYQRLVFNNLFGLLSGGYKKLRRAVGDEQFRKLVRAFLESGISRTPYFAEISGEFLNWFVQQDAPKWQHELAEYERAGIAIDIESMNWPSAETITNRPDGVHFSPAIALLSFDYAIYEANEGIEPPKQPTYILLYRNPHNKLRYKLLNAASFSLLALLLQEQSLGEALLTIATSMRVDGHHIEAPARDLLAELQREGAVVSLPKAVET